MVWKLASPTTTVGRQCVFQGGTEPKRSPCPRASTVRGPIAWCVYGYVHTVPCTYEYGHCARFYIPIITRRGTYRMTQQTLYRYIPGTRYDTYVHTGTSTVSMRYPIQSNGSISVRLQKLPESMTRWSRESRGEAKNNSKILPAAVDSDELGHEPKQAVILYHCCAMVVSW